MNTIYPNFIPYRYGFISIVKPYIPYMKIHTIHEYYIPEFYSIPVWIYINCKTIHSIHENPYHTCFRTTQRKYGRKRSPEPLFLPLSYLKTFNIKNRQNFSKIFQVLAKKEVKK